MEFLTVGADIGDTNFQIGTRLRNGEMRDFETHSACMLKNPGAEEVLSHVLLGYMVRHGIANRVRAVNICLPKADSGLGNLQNTALERGLSEKLGLHVSVQTHTAEGCAYEKK